MDNSYYKGKGERRDTENSNDNGVLIWVLATLAC